jgi:N-ethylmaleimide reductase
MSTLYESTEIGATTLSNRVVMAPMTRSRADAYGVPSTLAATYYAQRASAGLIITEGTQPSLMGQGYPRTPGIHTAEQVAAWQAVTDAVHAAGGRIFLQIMHTGRIGHPLNRKTDDTPVSPSAIAPATTQMYTDQAGLQAIPTPRALETKEIPAVIEEYVAATRNARQARFDGVELHGASGYLPDQFLCSETNHRNDAYGGSLVNRMRFTLETLEAMVAAEGSDYVGIKLSPDMRFNDCIDEDPEQTYSGLVTALNRFGLAYLHVGNFTKRFDVHARLRPLFEGPYLAGGGLRTAADGQDTLERYGADAVVYGQRFIANPDLVHRLKTGFPLADADESTFYTPGAAGYTDYPPIDPIPAGKEADKTDA